MPATITHFLFAKRVEEALLKRGIQYIPSTLYWGAQGPDFFFYHRALPHQMGKSLRRIGSRMHRSDAAETFGHMAAFLRRCPEEDGLRALSYAYGFLCHLTLDSAAHPYVYWFQEELARETGGRPAFMHHKIEHNLDTIMLRREWDMPPSRFPIAEAMPDDPPALEAAARMLRYVIARMYPDQSTSVIKLTEAFRDCRLSAGLLVDKKGRKRRALLGIEAKLPARVSLSSFICPDTPDADWDYANQSHHPWIDQGKGKGAVHNEDFFTLFDQNIQTAAELCTAYHRCVTEGEPTDFLSAYDFHNGGA
ncbi:MAG TPA: zinc dependent phospholipase C family protein [Firmicutes bacterium]|nr:zinc dependent phospholipase C family protein [Bacillota bacterium]